MPIGGQTWELMMFVVADIGTKCGNGILYRYDGVHRNMKVVMKSSKLSYLSLLYIAYL